MGHPEPADRLADLLGPPLRVRERRRRQDEHELLAAVPARDVPRPRRAAEQRAEARQDDVARLVAEGVVEVLEPVDVEEDQRQRPVLALRAAQLPIERLLHVPAVEQPGQRVADRLAAQGLPEPDVRQGERELLGHRHGEAHPGLAQASLGRPRRGARRG